MLFFSIGAVCYVFISEAKDSIGSGYQLQTIVYPPQLISQIEEP